MNSIIFSLAECPSEFQVLRVIYFGLILLRIAFVVIPIGIILMISIDLFKNVVASKEDDMKKNVNIAIKRIIYCICIFFVPSIVSLFVSVLDDLGVEYVSYIECANIDDIENVIINKADELMVIAKNNLDYSSYIEAESVISEIKDSNLRSKYEKELKFIKEHIDTYKPVVDNDDPIVSPDDGSSENINVNYPDEVVENLAAFIGSEAGGYPKGFLTQLLTGAVYINNYYDVINKEINLDTMCEMFGYESYYTSDYCYFNFDKLERTRSEVPEEHKKQLTVVAKILLSKKFTIPKHIQYQAADYIINNSNATIWAKTYTGLDAYPYGYFGYSNYYKPLEGIDIYGNKVSTNSNDYQAIADDLYKKYVK